MDSLRNTFGSPSPSSDPKSVFMEQIRQEANVNNARQLIDNINENCFEKCIPKPGTSLSKGEQTCMTQCMDKYMMAWNAISQSYIRRIQREQGSESIGSSL